MAVPTGTGPTHLSYKEAAAVCIFHAGSVCLAQRIETCPLSDKPLPFPGYWAPFGGAIETNESAMAAACRELKEEAQIDIQISDLEYMQEITNDDDSRYILYAYHPGSLVFPTLNFEHTQFGYFRVESLHISPNPLCPSVQEAIQSYEEIRWKSE